VDLYLNYYDYGISTYLSYERLIICLAHKVGIWLLITTCLIGAGWFLRPALCLLKCQILEILTKQCTTRFINSSLLMNKKWKFSPDSMCASTIRFAIIWIHQEYDIWRTNNEPLQLGLQSYGSIKSMICRDKTMNLSHAGLISLCAPVGFMFNFIW
jgi:hypothetical protein